MQRNLSAIVALSFLCLSLSAAKAQQTDKTPRIGVTLAGGSSSNLLGEALRQGLAELGWVEGQNILIEYRYAEGQRERYSAMMKELVDLEVDVIVSGGGGAAARAAMRLTDTIPIVIPVAGDPVAAGLVASLARPGGNVTGQSMQDAEVSTKRMQFLHQLLPDLKRVAILQDPRALSSAYAVRATEAAARAIGLQLKILSVDYLAELDGAFAAMKEEGTEALIVLSSSFFNMNRRQLIDLVAQHHLVAIYEHQSFVGAGGLMSYGPDITAMYRSAARYVDKILKGASPTELPIEQPTKFNLVINLETAKALGIEVPPSILLQADKVIQ